MDIFPKFIIEEDEELGNCLILSKVTFHRDIATNLDKVKGGGMFQYDNESNSFVFHGKSDQFGYAKLEDIKECVQSGKVFTNPTLTHNISERHSFYYDSGSKIINLKE